MRLCLLLLLCVGCARAPEPLRFGLLPTESSTDAAARWGPLIEALGVAAQRPAEPRSVGDYAALVEALRFQRVDLAYLGPKAYVTARERADVVPLAQEVPLDGEPNYHGVILTRADGPAQTLDDLRGGTFAFVEPNSASGYLVPLVHFLEDRHVAPEAYFGKVQFAGSHQAVMIAVLQGHVDAGATNDLDLARAEQKGSVPRGAFRELWRSPPIPGAVIVARSGLDPTLRERLRATLLGYDDPQALAALQNRGFVAVDDAVFEPVRAWQRVKAAAP